MKRLAILLLSGIILMGCGGDTNYYQYYDPPDEVVQDIDPTQSIYWDYASGSQANTLLDPSILEERMLRLPPQFVQELENSYRKSFALLEIQSRGVSDEMTSESDWHGATSQSNTDHDPAPPTAGDVILDQDTGETPVDSDPSFATADFAGSGWSPYPADPATYFDKVDESPNDGDSTYVYVGNPGGYREGTFSAADFLASNLPDMETIYSIKIGTYARGVNGGEPLKHRIYVNGASYLGGPTHTMTTEYVLYETEWTENPDTSSAWTRANLLDLTAFGYHSGLVAGQLRVTNCYIIVRFHGFYSTGNLVTSSFDLSSGNLTSNAIITIDDNVPTGAGLTYTIQGANNDWSGAVNLGAIADGSSVTGYKYYRVTANFTSDGSVTPVLKSIKIEIPDRIYRFNSFGKYIFNSYPYLSETPGRAIKLDLRTWLTVSSDLTVSMTKDDLVVQMLRENDFYGLNADLYLGMYSEGMTENDLVLVHRLLTKNYTIVGESVSIEFSDPSSTLLETKVPIGSGTTKPSESYDTPNNHMVDVILDLIDKAGVADRYIDRGSFDTLKANVGDGSPASANYVVKRTGATVLNESKPAKDLITELLNLLGAFIIVPESGKMVATEYDSSAAAVDEWGVDDFVEDPIWTPGLDEARDVCRVWYDWDGSGDSEDDFDSIVIILDNADSTLIKDIKSKWIAGDAGDGYYGAEISAHVGNREVNRLANGFGKFSCKTDIDKFAVQVGDMVNITHPDIVSPDVGFGDTVKFLVIQKDPPQDDTITWSLVEAR